MTTPTNSREQRFGRPNPLPESSHSRTGSQREPPHSRNGLVGPDSGRRSPERTGMASLGLSPSWMGWRRRQRPPAIARLCVTLEVSRPGRL
jgi:hypothetical protein